MEELEEVNIQKMAVHCRLKKEVYDILTLRGNVYLPKIQDINSDFISDIIQGRK